MAESRALARAFNGSGGPARDEPGSASGDARMALPSVSVVIPALNEAANLPWVLQRLPRFVDEVILVDGESTDDTVAVARALCPEIAVIVEKRRGKGAALRSGFAAATGDVIVMIDADGSMDPAEIWRFTALVQSGFDLVKGSRYMSGGGSADLTRIRSLGNRMLCSLVNGLYWSRYSDLCYGFMAIRRSCLPALALAADGFEIETEIVVRASRVGLRVCEAPSFELPRLNGTSKLRSVRDGLRVLRTLLARRIEPARVTSSGDGEQDVVIDLTETTLRHEPTLAPN